MLLLASPLGALIAIIGFGVSNKGSVIVISVIGVVPGLVKVKV